MITEDYVSFDTAKLLKEKGFNEKCLMCWDEVTKTREIIDDGLTLDTGATNSELLATYISAPTIQMAMKWLRETHNIFMLVHPDFRIDCIKFDAYILPYRPDKTPNAAIEMGMCEDTYEAVCDEAIKYCLEKLI